jgi:two-component system heavy metal sensor histidine kinase CusS
MKPLSLNARLTLIHAIITALCFALVGTVLYGALSDQVHEQADSTILLAARHLRRLIGEFNTVAEVRAHRERLITLVLGDPSIAMTIVDATIPTTAPPLIDYNPSNLAMVEIEPVPPTQRILAEQIRRWTGDDGVRNQGVAAEALLGDGSIVHIAVARRMLDRAAFLTRYRYSILTTLMLGTVVATFLGYLLVGRALRPLSAIAADARHITVHRLDRRIDVRQAPAELQDLIVALNAMLKRLEQGFDRVWQFTADLAHDIRTPISNVRGASEVALSRVRSSAEYQAVLASNVEECEGVARMIDKVLFLARAENPQFAIKRCGFDARTELLHVADYFEGPAADSGVQMRVEGNAFVRADKDLFRRAVSNLLANALRYTPRGGTIELGAEQRDGDVMISVTNPGEGISAEDADKVFDRFYRADKARSRALHPTSQSTGLGLAIVRTILELHGGEASLRREEPGKTRFELRFPIAAAASAMS